MSEIGGVTNIASSAAAQRTAPVPRSTEEHQDRAVRRQDDQKPEEAKDRKPERRLDIHV